MTCTPDHELMDIAPEVSRALAEDRPVVALESTIITHGMPHPDNLAMVMDVEAIVRRHEAVPATIAVRTGESASDWMTTGCAGSLKGGMPRRRRGAISPR